MSEQNFIHGFSQIPAIQAIEDETERRRVIQQFADRNDINIFQGQRFDQDEQGITRCTLFPSPMVPDGTAVEFYAELAVHLSFGGRPLRGVEARPVVSVDSDVLGYKP